MLFLLRTSVIQASLMTLGLASVRASLLTLGIAQASAWLSSRSIAALTYGPLPSRLENAHASMAQNPKMLHRKLHFFHKNKEK